MDAGRISAEVRKLRELNGLSQEEMGQRIGLSRTAVAMIESGKRKLSAFELMEMARVFNLTLDQFVHPEKRPETTIEGAVMPEATAEPCLRISMPQHRYDVFREVLLYILAKIGARPHVGQTVLYKLLYFIDFDYYEKYEEQLIGATYIRNHYGPTPTHFTKLVRQMEEEGSLVKVTSDHFGYPQTKYLPVEEPDLGKLTGRAVEMMDEVLGRLGSMNAAGISEYSHHDVPWMMAEEGKPIDYEAVFYRTPAYSVRSDAAQEED